MTEPAPLRILVEPSDYVLRNLGDMAMMQVAVSRLAARWPDAAIRVLSDDPVRLPRYAPNVTALDSAGRTMWLRTRLVPGSVHRLLPPRAREWVERLGRLLRVRGSRSMQHLARWRVQRSGRDAQPLADYLDILARADLVLATGMGGITDAFPAYAFDLLETIDSASRRGAVTAMMGQGMGPLDDVRLRRYAAKVLDRVDLIALREARAGKPLLEQVLKVDPERITTTGDDAIELGFHRMTDHLGTDVGVNLRISDYSGITETTAKAIGEELRAAAALLAVELVPLPISTVAEEDDRKSIDRYLTGTDASASAAVPSDIDHVLTAISGCRLVVTGSYHAAVFALSMGVPAIGLAGSRYYEDKFLGLAAQFGDGCEVVVVNSDDERATIHDRVVDLWKRADVVRSSLRVEAANQLELSQQAYATVERLVQQRRREVRPR